MGVSIGTSVFSLIGVSPLTFWLILNDRIKWSNPITQEVLHLGKDSVLLVSLERHKWEWRLYFMMTHENSLLPLVVLSNFSLMDIILPWTSSVSSLRSCSLTFLSAHLLCQFAAFTALFQTTTQLTFVFLYLPHPEDSMTWNPSVSLAVCFPGGSGAEESACNVGDLGSRAGKIPGRRIWQPTPVLLPEESPWTEEPGGLQSMGLQRVG